MKATISAESRIHTLLDNQRRVLERIAEGAELADSLGLLANLIEDQAQGMHCAVLLADHGQKRLRFVAAPSLPKEFMHCMEPYLGIALDMGNCGIAAFRKEPVYTRDTATDPVWDKCREIALRNGLRAVWSTPVVSDDGRVLGTFAMYYREPRLPGEQHIQLIDMAVQMARVAIDAKADEELLRTIFDDSPAAMLVCDVAGTIIRANSVFSQRLGYSPADLQGIPVLDISDRDDSTALAGELVSNGPELVTDRKYRTRSGAELWAREHSTLRYDPSGKPRFVLSRITRFSNTSADPLDGLSARERQVLELVVAGNTSKVIAARLHLSPASVDTYRSRIMTKLGLEGLPALVRFAIRHGIASL